MAVPSPTDKKAPTPVGRAALLRLSHHGIEIGSAEMVLFEWMETADHLCFREVAALIK
jgi:hypothetical protein